MDKINKETEYFNEIQSLQTIKEMIEVSHKNLQNDGILFIVWGWIYFITYFFLNYLPSVFVTTYNLMQTIRFYRVALPLFGLAFTIYYIYKRQKKVATYIGISLRYVWISLFISLVLVNLIQFNSTTLHASMRTSHGYCGYHLRTLIHRISPPSITGICMTTMM